MDIKAFRGLSGTYNVRANERDRSTPRNIECLVQFLNNTQHKFIIDRRSDGQCLLDCVFKHLNLIETDFFGLKYLPQESHRQQHHITNCLDNCNNNNDIATLKCNNNISNHNNNNNNKVLLTKTQSLNSYEDYLSPSPDNSLSSSSAATSNNNNNNNNHHLNATDSTNNINSTTTNSHNSTKHVQNDCSKNSNNISITNISFHNNANGNNNISTFIEERWLDPTKSIRKQYKSGPPYKFYFRVKFYVSDPCKLADDTTRNHLYLQLRQDILNNRLIVPTCSAILLASYILQSEVGDYKRELQEENYASNFRLLPNQSDDIKKKVIELHKQHKSLSSADAEYQFLEHAAKKLDCYGVEFYEAKDFAQTNVQIGVSSNGIVVFKDNKRMSQFSWAKIIKIMFKKKIFSVQLRRDQGEVCDNFIEYNLLTNQACKSFWEECVAQHSFFRLHQPKSPPKKFFSFLNFGSKFQYNGKTEYQTMEESRKRSFSHFSRTPSKRYARRTIAIGRPSWSESSAQSETAHNNIKTNKTSLYVADECEQVTNGVDEKDNHSDKKVHKVDTKNEITNNSSWLFTATTAIASCSSTSTTRSADDTNLLNVTVDPRSSAYRPKSLTLKSFIYIDESKNVSSGEHSQVSNFDTNNNTALQNSSQDYQNDEPGSKTNNAHKKDLKRTESLKISNSIKEALSLTKKAGVSSGSQLIKISESLREKFLTGKSKPKKTAKKNSKVETIPKTHQQKQDSDDLETNSEISTKIVKLCPGKDGKYGFKIREVVSATNDNNRKAKKKSKDSSIIIYDVSPLSPAATCDPRLYEGDQLLTINGFSINGLSESEVESLVKNIQNTNPPDLILGINSKFNLDCASIDSSLESHYSNEHRISPDSNLSHSKRSKPIMTLAESIKEIKRRLEGNKKDLIEEFDKLSRKKEDESLDESKLSENIDKNRYRDILPYDSTRVQLIDSMTGDYINASFVNMPVPSGTTNKYIATQGPLSSTCDDFWQMVWEQNSSLIIMVTPLIEAGRVKCHKYWPDEKEEVRHGQILVRNVAEKSKSATIDRTIQLIDVKSGDKRITSQIQYKAWPDHEVPEDCSDFLKLVNRVRKHRITHPDEPIVVHCSAGIGRTGVLILMETAICIMECGNPVFPIKILEDMRKQRAMLIQTSSQFQFVADAICKVYDQKLYKKSKKHRKKTKNISS